MSNNPFIQYFSTYMGSRERFDEFHNNVINMPRDHFDGINIGKVRVLAGYLLLISDVFDKENGGTYKDIMKLISLKLSQNNYPNYRDANIENRYFNFTDIDCNYEKEGRMFRHLMELCLFFGLLNVVSKRLRKINIAKCEEYYYANDNIIKFIARNNILSFNINDNGFIATLSGVSSVNTTASYRPTFGILSYMQRIERPVTKFELSVLLGRLDDLQNEQDIINRALDIGRLLPNVQVEQQYFFFEQMNWCNGEVLYRYKRSQEPYFKFNIYIVLLESLELIKKDISNNYILTDYADRLLQDDISYLISDLEDLISRIDLEENGLRKGELNDLILAQRNPQLLMLAKNDQNFIQKMNKRSIRKPIIDKKGKKVRNRIIAELAKIQADYKCQYAQRHTFKMPDGKYYCEAHHIIRFGDENGPDITNNLIVLGPEAHMLVHHAITEAVTDLYLTLRVNNVLTYERFEEMITVYNCLDKAQIELLFTKKIITSDEKESLMALL